MKNIVQVLHHILCIKFKCGMLISGALELFVIMKQLVKS